MSSVDVLTAWFAARSEVRNAHGVKIYFDPVSTAARQVTAKKLAASVLEDPARQVSFWHCSALLQDQGNRMAEQHWGKILAVVCLKAKLT